MQASDYYMYNFNALLVVGNRNDGKITDVDFYKYTLPDVFTNGRCDSSQDFIICESDVRDFFNIPIVKIDKIRRKMNVMTIYPKI
jgi:hypothetical protein